MEVWLDEGMLSRGMGESLGVIIRLHLADIGNTITETKIRIFTDENIISTEKHWLFTTNWLHYEIL